MSGYTSTTDADRAAVAKEIRDLSGKPQEPVWKFHVQPTIKNVDGSTTEGGVLRENTQTGQIERVDLNASGPRVPLDKNPAALAIKNDTKLSNQEKVAKLRALGYQ